MADVQSTATLTLNVVGEDKVKSLASSLNEIKSSAGETASSVGQSFSNIEQSAKGAETRLKKLDELSYRAPRPGEAGFEEERAKHEAWMAQVEERSAARKRERPGGAFAAEPIKPEAAPMPMATGLQSAAEVAAAALVGLGFAAVAAGAAIKGFNVASEAAAKSSRDILQTTATAQRAGIDFEQAQRERMAGEALFGEAGFRRVEERLERSIREGGKGVARDLEAIGVSPTEARPTPLSLAQRAVARREELTRAIQEAPTEEARAAAQATMNSFTSALIRRAGPDMSRVAAEQSTASLDAQLEGARRTAEAFRRDIEPQQLAEQARALERSQAQLKQSQDQAWKNFGEYAAPGVTDLTEQLNKTFTQQAPALSAAGGAVASGLASGAATYLGAKNTQWEMFGGMVRGVKGLFGAAPAEAAEAPAAAAAKAPAPAPEEMPKLQPPSAEELPKIQVDTAGLEQVTGMGEQIGASISSSLSGIDMSGVGANIGASIQSSIAGIDMSGVGANIGASISSSLSGIDMSGVGASIGASISSSLAGIDMSGVGASIGASIQSSLAGIDLSAAGAGVGEAIGSAASASINAAGSSGGAAFSAAVQGGINAAGSSGGAAFSAAASSGITAAGSAGGAAFNAAVNGSAIGSAIGSAAAAVISAARVQVNVSVPAGASGGGGTTGGATTGKDSAT